MFHPAYNYTFASVRSRTQCDQHVVHSLDPVSAEVVSAGHVAASRAIVFWSFRDYRSKIAPSYVIHQRTRFYLTKIGTYTYPRRHHGGRDGGFLEHVRAGSRHLNLLFDSCFIAILKKSTIVSFLLRERSTLLRSYRAVLEVVSLLREGC